MKVAVRIDATAALKAGKNAAGTRVIDIDPADLSQDEREMLADKCRTSCGDLWAGGVVADLYLVYAPGPTVLIDATPEGLKRVLAESMAKRAAEAEIARKRAEKEEAERLTKLEWVTTCPIGELIERDYRTKYNEWQAISWVTNYLPADHPRWHEIQAECLRRNTAEAAARDAREKSEAEAKRLKEEKRAAGEKVLAAWADAHGSELLQARKADGFEWIKLARNEFADAVAAEVIGLAALAGAGVLEVATVPSGYTFADADDREYPTLEEIKLLRAVRATIKDRNDVNADLLWVAYKPTPDEDDYNCDDTPLNRCELRLTITTPDGGYEDRDFCLATPVAQ